MKLRAFVGCLSMLLPLACGGVDDGGSDTEASQQSIVNGEVTTAYPQVMQLMIPNLDGTTTYCSGTLYAPLTLVTAAHCLDQAGTVLAYWGDDFWGGFEQLFEPEPYNWRFATDWVIHPNWNPDTVDSDIAVVHLDRPLPFDPIPIAFRHIGHRYVGDTVTIVGWGAESGDLSGVNVKRTGASEIEGTPAKRPLPPNPHPGLTIGRIRTQLLEIDGTAPNSNSCFGDSGGPALLDIRGQEKIVGVASWTGDNCEGFSYYVRVDRFLPFLLKNAQ